MISLARLPDAFCNICQRRHGYNEIYNYVETFCIDCYVVIHSDCYIVGCFRASGSKITILRTESSGTESSSVESSNTDEIINSDYDKYIKSFKYRSADYPGWFPDKTPDCGYTEPPAHESGRGCKIILHEDYIHGSACGIGKSYSAWKSIKPDQSALCISYRKTFTEKTRSDYNLESYNDIHGDIIFDPKHHRRVITQIEYIVRVRGIPYVLVVDEWHGFLRQIFSSRDSKTTWEKFAGLITAAHRVIVLDADANNDDVMLFRGILSRSDLKFIVNDYQPNHDKKFIVEQSHRDNFEKLLDTLAAGNRAVVFTYYKRHGNYSVESLAKQHQHRNYRVKYFHADTDPAVKQKDLSDVNVVIYNLTVEAGISIVDDHFRSLLAFSEQLGSVEATKQALHRFRNINEIHYSTNYRGNNIELPLTPDDIIDVIESHERDLSETELIFRAPNLGEVNTSYGYAYISSMINENNSKCYFT